MGEDMESYIKKLENRVAELEKKNCVANCGNCKHFYQHYVLVDGRYKKVYCGHCITPQIKTRKPDQAACNYWESIE